MGIVRGADGRTSVRVSRIATPRLAFLLVVLGVAFAGLVVGWAASQGTLLFARVLVGACLVLWPAAAWRWLTSATVRFDPVKRALRGEVDDAVDVPVEEIVDVAVHQAADGGTVTGLNLRDGSFAPLFHSTAAPPTRSIELLQDMLEQARRAHPDGSTLPWRTPRVFAVGASRGLWTAASFVPVIAALLPAQIGFGPGLLVATVMALLVGLALFRALGSATVLADGIAVRRGGATLFLSFAQMAALERVGKTPNVAITHAGRQVPLAMRSAEAFVEEAKRRRQAFLERAHEAVPAELLKEVSEGEPEGAYRRAELRPSDLWRVAENPAAPAVARTHALAALRVAGDVEARARVDAVIAVTGDPRIRIALEQAAEEAQEEEEAVAAAAPARATR